MIGEETEKIYQKYNGRKKSLILVSLMFMSQIMSNEGFTLYLTKHI